MKKSVYIIAAIAILGILAIYAVPDKKPVATSSQSSGNIQEVAQVGATDNQSAQDQTLQPATAVLKDGTFVGDLASNQFGNVEVAVVISGGKITEVQLLQMPDGDSRSKAISDQVSSQLVESTLTQQSSDIDTISGATYTTLGYIDSLQSAIDQAKS
jgi:uncharacterized protein with FMN-binding domain